MKRFLLFFLGIGLSFVILADTSNQPVYPVYPKSTSQSDLVKKGEYLAKAGDCIACHSDPKHGGQAFAGGLGIKTPFGTFYSPNITMDKETGIGSWSDAEFVKAMREGMGPEGNYFPVFPYNYFNRVNDEDILAIKAYLESIPPLHRVNTPHDVLPPFNWRIMQWGWKLLFFQWHKGLYQYDQSQTTEWNRGAYLVQGLGHCAMCHSPLNLMGAVKSGQELTGGFIEGYYAPDITSRGLNDASVNDIVNVFKKGQMLHGAGKVEGPMAEVNQNSLRYLSDADLRAIAVYLKTVPNNLPVKKAATDIGPNTGEDIYENHCAVCHNVGAAGAPKLGDSNVWQPRILEGMDVLFTHAINGYNSMPPRGTCMSCSDGEIKAAVQYLVDKSKEGASGMSAPKSNVPTQPKLTIQAAKAIYQTSCADCHAKGKNGAPKMGDKKAWSVISDQDMEIIYGNVFKTHKNINNSDSEIIAATKYMIQQNQAGSDYSLW